MFINIFIFSINSWFYCYVEIFVFLFSFSLWEAFHSIIYILSDVKDRRESITQNLLTNVDFVDKGEVEKKEITSE